MHHPPDNSARWRDCFDKAELTLKHAEQDAPTGEARDDLIQSADRLRRSGIKEFNSSGGDCLELLDASKGFAERVARLGKPATAAQSILDLGSELDLAVWPRTDRERYEFLKAVGIAYLEEGDFQRALNLFSGAQYGALDNPFQIKEFSCYQGFAYIGLGDLNQAGWVLAGIAQDLPNFDSTQRSKLGHLLVAAVRELHNTGGDFNAEPFCVAVIGSCSHDAELSWAANLLRARSMERQGYTADAFNHLKDLHLAIEERERPEFLETLEQVVQCSIRINEPGAGLYLLAEIKAEYPPDSLPPLTLGVLEAELHLATGDLARARQIAEQVNGDHGRQFRFLTPIEQIRNERVLALAMLQNDPHGALSRIEKLQRIALSEPDPELGASLMYAEAYGYYLKGDLAGSLHVLDRLHAATYPLHSRERSIHYPHGLLLMSTVIGAIPENRFPSPEAKQTEVTKLLEEALKEYNAFGCEPKAVEGGADVMLQLALNLEALDKQSAALPYLFEAIRRLEENQQEGTPLYIELVDTVRKLGPQDISDIDIRDLARKRADALKIIESRSLSGNWKRPSDFNY